MKDTFLCSLAVNCNVVIRYHFKKERGYVFLQSLLLRLSTEILIDLCYLHLHTAVTLLQIRGLAVAVKPKNGRQNASVTRVMNVTVGNHQRRGFTLSPGINDKWRHTTVLGESIGDVPTRYTITGLEAHELPVIGEWVNTQRTLPP